KRQRKPCLGAERVPLLELFHLFGRPAMEPALLASQVRDLLGRVPIRQPDMLLHGPSEDYAERLHDVIPSLRRVRHLVAAACDMARLEQSIGFVAAALVRTEAIEDAPPDIAGALVQRLELAGIVILLAEPAER